MLEWIENEQPELNMAEIYRQNYMDARDMVNDLQFEIADLRNELKIARSQLEAAENHIADSEFKWYELEKKAAEIRFRKNSY